MIRLPTRHALRPVTASLVVATLLTGQTTAPALASVPMATHHAVYKLTLLKAKGANAPRSASGIIDYNFSGSACAGYRSKLQQLTTLQPAEGAAHVNVTRSLTSEDAGGKEFTFSTKTRNDDDRVSDLDGEARKMPDGQARIRLTIPPSRLTLGGDVLFPTEHLRRIIGVAEAGGKLLEAKVYDGSGTGKKLFDTLTVIGKPIPASSKDPIGQLTGLAAVQRWPVTISYFEAGKEDAPDYVLSFDLYENGISRALRLDYGDFVLAGELTDLTVSTPAPCR